MAVYVSPMDQKTADRLWINISMALCDLTELHTRDTASENKKHILIKRLNEQREMLKKIGVVHRNLKKIPQTGHSMADVERSFR